MISSTRQPRSKLVQAAADIVKDTLNKMIQ